MSKYQLEPEFEHTISGEFGQIEMFAILTASKESGRSQVYNVRTGGSVLSTPMAFRERLYFGTCDHNFYCLDLKTGKEIWRFLTNGPVVGCPDILGNLVIFGSYDCNLYAVSLDGMLEWKFSTNDKICSVTAQKNRIYFGNRDGTLYALDSKGNLLWKFYTGSPISAYPVIHNGVIYIGNFDGNFFAISIEGQVLWKKYFNGQIAFAAAANNKFVIVSAGQTVTCMTHSGDMLWRFSARDMAYRPLISDHIYFGSRDNNLYALSTDGKLVWKFSASDTVSAIATAEDRVFASSWDGNLYCVDARTGKKLWSFAVGAPVPSLKGLLIHEGVLYLGSFDCKLFAITENGELLWTFHSSLSYTSPVDIDRPEDKTAQIIWKPAVEDKKKAENEERVEIADYGELSSKYVDTSKSDYLGRKKKGYI